MLPLVSPTELTRPLTKQAQAIARKYSGAGKIHVLRPREGRAYEEICAAALQLKADLIVITTHGYTGFKRVFLGSTAERVVQRSLCPVLVVRQQPRDNSKWNLRVKKILVPIDFSSCSQVAFNYSARLARDFHAELRLVHVINPHCYPFGAQYAALDAARLIQEACNSAQREMCQMATQANVRFSVRIRKGSPAPEICIAANKNVDLIVIPTHGRTGLDHVFIGSTAERVVRGARCSVLVIPTKISGNRTKRRM